MILLPFFMFNLLFLMGSFLQSRTVKLLLKTMKQKEQVKDAYYMKFKIFNIAIWILVGTFFLVSLDNPFSLGGVMVLLAFRSGASLSRRFIFGIHDIRILKKNLPENKILDIVSVITKFSTFIELLFVLTWGILYQYLSASVNSLFGIEVNLLTLFLWVAGFCYGIIGSVVQSIISKQFILRNELGIALLFSGQIIADKVEKKKNYVRKLFKFKI